MNFSSTCCVLLLLCLLGCAKSTKPDTAAQQSWQEPYHAATESYARGDYSIAATQSARAMADATEQFGADSGAVASASSLDGAIRLAMADYTGAEAAFLIAVRYIESMPDQDVDALAIIYNNLAEVERERGNHAVAVAWQRKRLALTEGTLGAAHPSTGAALGSLALALHDAGALTEAEACYIRAIAVLAASLDKNGSQVRRAQGNYADLLARTNRSDEALRLLQQVLALERTELGERHPDVAATLNTYATVQSESGNPSTALLTYAEALSIRREVFGDSHPAVATVLSNMAVTSADMGRKDDARRFYTEAIAILGASQRTDSEQMRVNKRALEALDQAP